MAEGWNADTRMADAQLAVTRHLKFVSTFALLHRPQADLHVCTEDSTWCCPYPLLFASSRSCEAVLSAQSCWVTLRSTVPLTTKTAVRIQAMRNRDGSPEA
jgi:hypothetical protein